MIQPPNTPLSIDSLNDFIDYDLGDSNSNWSEVETKCDQDQVKNVEHPSKRILARVFSALANLAQVFVRPWPKRYIDSNDDDHIISREESEYRLILIFIGCTIILSMTTTSLLISCPFHIVKQDILILNPEPKSEPKSLKVPHILIIYRNGSMIDFSTNEALSPSKNVTMQLTCFSAWKTTISSTQECSVTAYADHKKIYIFYGNTKHDITEIDFKTFQPKIVPDTKVKNVHENGIGVQVGTRFLILGGFHVPKINSQNSNQLYIQLQMNKVDTWSIIRKKFIKSFAKISALVEYSCVTSFNQSHFILVNKPKTNGNVSMFSIETWMETRLPRIPLPSVPVPNAYVYDINYDRIEDPQVIQSRVTCDIDFDKHRLQRLVAIAKMHCESNPVNWNYECSQDSDEISVLYQFNFDTQEWTQESTNLKYFGTLRIVNGIKYFFNVFNPERHFGYYYESKNDTWITLGKLGYSHFEGDGLFAEIQENIIAVPYLA